MNNNETENGDSYTQTNRDLSRLPPSIQVINGVADAAGCSVDELAPLYEVVNPDALDRLYAPTYRGNMRSSGEVTFSYAGYHIAVDDSGTVDISPTEP
ncbi:HalOD1 output domain-containing protein [Haladaptatus pallidirubidus]|uniref:Halobacterial output domain-containing protein n=1 Tax=Haladaptatus pallidirubidus TaxID=1008152 RepID=A0AAV3UJG7_9EURY|nr:HalOD1 output domain-containing protein [Haladaptatus pallidirubidus]